MRRWSVALVGLAACGGVERAELPDARAAAPGAGGATLDAPSSVVSGETVTLRVTASDLAPGDPVTFAWASAMGTGPCPQRQVTGGSPCLEITGGPVVLGRVTAADDPGAPGTAYAELTTPLVSSDGVRFVQAFVSRGALSSTTNVAEVAIEQPYPVLSADITELLDRVQALEDQDVVTGDDLASLQSAIASIGAGGDGSSQALAGRSCAQLHHDYPALVDGVYWVDTTGAPTDDAFQVRCDFATASGTWAMCAYASTPSNTFSRRPTGAQSANVEFCGALPNGLWADKIVKLNSPNGASPNTWVQAGGVFSMTTTNRYVDASSKVLSYTQARGSGTSLWTASGLPSTATLGAANHGSWCGATPALDLYMHSPNDGSIGGHPGVQASQGGCDDNANWKDNFQWSVWTRF